MSHEEQLGDNEFDVVDKSMILGTIEDMISDFLYYDRKGDEELRVGDIDKAVRDGVVTVDEMVNKFREGLEKHLDI